MYALLLNALPKTSRGFDYAACHRKTAKQPKSSIGRVVCSWLWSIMTAKEKHPKFPLLSVNAQDLIKQLMEPDPHHGSKFVCRVSFGHPCTGCLCALRPFAPRPPPEQTYLFLCLPCLVCSDCALVHLI